MQQISTINSGNEFGKIAIWVKMQSEESVNKKNSLDLFTKDKQKIYSPVF